MVQRLLILSDGRPGHLNQSLALARLLGCEYDVLRVGFPTRLHKVCSYLLGAVSAYRLGLISHEKLPPQPFVAVVSAGSDTYYAGLALARQLGCQAIAVMLPRGYRCSDFSRIIAQEHDQPPRRSNVLTVPVNLSFPVPQGVFKPHDGIRYVALMVGGPNQAYAYDPDAFRSLLDDLFVRFPEHRLVVTTSRRTPPDIEMLIDRYPFDARFIFSRQPVNPIPDFLATVEYAFITTDSTSMISEAVSFGRSCVEIVPLVSRRSPGKYQRMINALSARGCLHVFDGTLGKADHKIALSALLDGVLACA